MHVMSVHRRNGEIVPACPRPYSRKKLRSLMHRNHQALTADALWGTFRRKPGAGLTRSRLMDTFDRLEAQMAHRQSEIATDSKLAAFFGVLRRMFRTGSERQPRRIVRAARAK